MYQAVYRVAQQKEVAQLLAESHLVMPSQHDVAVEVAAILESPESFAQIAAF